MTNPTDPAFPANFEIVGNASGLTKLELFAAMAMQGFCANAEIAQTSAGSIAFLAVEQADALIAALEKEQVSK